MLKLTSVMWSSTLRKVFRINSGASLSLLINRSVFFFFFFAEVQRVQFRTCRVCVLRWRRDLTGGCILSKFSLACRSLVKRVVGEHDTLLKDISIRHKITAFFSRLREACACMRGENENKAFPQTWFYVPKKKKKPPPFSLSFFSTLVLIWLVSLLLLLLLGLPTLLYATDGNSIFLLWRMQTGTWLPGRVYPPSNASVNF